jgi:hypothetical protein
VGAGHLLKGITGWARRHPLLQLLKQRLEMIHLQKQLLLLFRRISEVFTYSRAFNVVSTSWRMVLRVSAMRGGNERGDRDDGTMITLKTQK